MVAENPSDAEFMRKLETAPVEIDQWQLEKLGLVTRKCQVLFAVPGLPPRYHGSLWGPSYQTAQQAVDGLAVSLVPGSTVAVIPEGPYVLARLAETPVGASV